MKILIVKLGSIGDVIHTLPVISAIKRALPTAEVSWVVEKKSAEILRNNQILSRLIEIDTKVLKHEKTIGETLLVARQQLNELRASTFDVALDFQGLLKSAMVAKISRSRRRFGFSKKHLREPAGRFLLDETFEVPQKTHVILKNLHLLKSSLKIDIPTENFEFPIFSEEKHLREAEKIAEQAEGDFAILNPAGGWVTKLWPTENFARLADELWQKYQITSIITTAPNEKHLAEKVLQENKTGKVFHVMPSLKGFYELAKRAKIYVGGDTGPTHLAVAAKTPIVGIFGPTEWWRNGSPEKLDICVERNDIGCRINCHRRTCGNWICLNIEVERVLQAVQKRLELTN